MRPPLVTSPQRSPRPRPFPTAAPNGAPARRGKPTGPMGRRGPSWLPPGALLGSLGSRLGPWKDFKSRGTTANSRQTGRTRRRREGRGAVLGHLRPSWARGRASCTPTPKQIRGKLVERHSWAFFASSWGPLEPLEGLRAPRHQGKPGANSSNNGPSWGFLGPTGGALGPPGVPGSRLGRPLRD